MTKEELDWEYIQEQAEILEREFPGKHVLDNLAEVVKWRDKGKK